MPKPEKGLMGKTTKVLPSPVNMNLFGQEADAAKGEGWYPTAQPDQYGTMIYRNSYNPSANTIQIPGEKNYGHLAAIGYKNGRFDIVIRDANGNTRQVVKQGVSPTDVRAYMTTSQSPIAQRVAGIQANAAAGNTYVAPYNPNNVK